MTKNMDGQSEQKEKNKISYAYKKECRICAK